MIDRRSAHVSVERETIAEDGVVRREQLRDEYARHEEGADGAVGGAVVGGAIGGNAGGTRTEDVRRCETVPNAGPPQYWDTVYVFRGVEHHIQTTGPAGPTITVNERGEPRN